MATIRVEKSKHYSVISNNVFEDKRLSLKAVGLLCEMLHQPDDWTFTLKHLAKTHKDGIDSVRSGMNELIETGYITRTQGRSKSGTYGDADYIVREVPCYTLDYPTLENPTTENPTTDKPITENPMLLNTNIPNTNIPNTNDIPKPPQGAMRIKEKEKKTKEPKREPDWKPDRFEEFWEYYPRMSDGSKPAKAKAARAWDKLKPDDDCIREMAIALQRQKESELWSRGIGIPYASSWLNARRWEDDWKEPEEISLEDRPPWIDDMPEW